MISLLTSKPWTELALMDVSTWVLKIIVLIIISSSIIVSLIELLKRLIFEVVKVEVKEPVSYIAVGKNSFSINIKDLFLWAINIFLVYTVAFKIFAVEYWYINLSFLILNLFVVEFLYQQIKKMLTNIFQKNMDKVEDKLTKDETQINNTEKKE